MTLSPQIPEPVPLTTDDSNRISVFVLTNVRTESAVSTCRSHPIREGRDDDAAADRDGREEDDRIMLLSLWLFVSHLLRDQTNVTSTRRVL